MEEKNVSYLVFESIMARNERHIKRLTIALMVSVILIFLSNAIWLYAWCQYDYTSESTTYSQDGQGLNIIGDNNVTEENNEGKSEDK